MFQGLSYPEKFYKILKPLKNKSFKGVQKYNEKYTK